MDRIIDPTTLTDPKLRELYAQHVAAGCDIQACRDDQTGVEGIFPCRLSGVAGPTVRQLCSRHAAAAR